MMSISTVVIILLALIAFWAASKFLDGSWKLPEQLADKEKLTIKGILGATLTALLGTLVATDPKIKEWLEKINAQSSQT